MPYIPVLYRFARCIYIMDFHSAWTYTNNVFDMRDDSDETIARGRQDYKPSCKKSFHMGPKYATM